MDTRGSRHPGDREYFVCLVVGPQGRQEYSYGDSVCAATLLEDVVARNFPKGAVYSTIPVSSHIPGLDEDFQVAGFGKLPVSHFERVVAPDVG